MTWTGSSASSFKIERWTSESDWQVIGQTGAHEWIDDSREANVTYRYQVTAVSGNLESSPSNTSPEPRYAVAIICNDEGSLATAVNADGAVVGIRPVESQSGDLDPDAGFYWNGENLTTIPHVYPADINDAGVVVGNYALKLATENSGYDKPFRWTASGQVLAEQFALPVPPDNPDYGTPVWCAQINNPGQVAGSFSVDDAAKWPMIWSGGESFLCLPPQPWIGDGGLALAINDSGVVAGIRNEGYTIRGNPAIWRDGVIVLLDSIDTALVTDINEDAIVVGAIDGVGALRWMEAQSPKLISEGLTSAIAQAVNDRKIDDVDAHRIVGHAGERAYVWEKDPDEPDEYLWHDLNDFLPDDSHRVVSRALDINDSSVVVGRCVPEALWPPSAPDNQGVACILLSVEFIGVKLDANGKAVKDAQGKLTFDRSLGSEPPKSEYQRMNRYEDWQTRTIHQFTSKDDENYGIKGLLRDKKEDTVQKENTDIAPLTNLDRMLFKVRWPSLGTQANQKIKVTPYVVQVDQNGQSQDVAGQVVEINLVDDPNSDQLITEKTLLLYEDPDNRLDTAQVQALLPADVLLIKADKIGILPSFVTGQEPSKFPAKQPQLYVANGGAPLLEHDSTVTQSAITAQFQPTGQIDPDQPITEPSEDDRRFFFWIDEDDRTSDIRLTFKNEDGTAFGGGTVEWFLLYKFKAGNFNWREARNGSRNPGTVYDIQQWHKLATTELRLKDQHEIKTPEGLGGLSPGDYELFCRVKRREAIYESNLIRFKVLAKNPADGGRGVKDQANATAAQLMPARIGGYVDTLANPVREGITFDLHGWYKGIISEESGYAPYNHRQDFDNSERVPETAGVDMGFQRSIRNPANTQWHVRFGLGLVGYDNGWGISQQTQSRNEDGNPTGGPARDTPFVDVARWKGNVYAGWKELISKLDEAIPYLKGLHGTTNLAAVPNEQVIREAVKRYNGGVQYRRGSGGGVVERPSGNEYQRTYVTRVQNRKQRIEGAAN